MRLVHVLVSDDRRADVLDALDDEGVDYVLTREVGAEGDAGREHAATDGDGSDRSVVEFPVPSQAVEVVLERLHDVGVADEYVVVASAETARTPNFEDLESRYVSGTDQDDSIAREEIRSRALDATPGRVAYYAMTLLSAFVATAGLLLDSPALVVGSMVIAPQVGSALTASVGTVLNDRGMIRDGLRDQALGLAVAVVGAAAFGVMLRHASFVPAALHLTTVNQIGQRISPGFVSAGVAVAAGLAGAVGLATAVSEAMVGVMIAAALIPAAAAVGIGVAWGIPAVALGAFVLLVVNAVSINLSAVAGLLWLGYRPNGRDETGLDPRRLWPMLAAVAVLVAVFAGAGVVMTDQVAFESDANSAVEDVLSESAYDQVDLMSVRADFTAGPLGGPRQLTVVVKKPADERYPELARRIRDRVAAETGGPVAVELQFVDARRVGP